MTSQHSKTPWVYCTTGSQLTKALSDLILTSRLIALDIETTGLDPWHDQLLLVQLGTKEKSVIIDMRCCGNDIGPLREFLASDKWGKLGHNLSFDCSFLEVYGLPVRGQLVDTFLGSKVLTSGLPEKAGLNSLAACSEKFLGKRLEEKTQLQKSFIGHLGEFTDAQLEYAAADVGPILWGVYESIRLTCISQNLEHVWQLECRALPAFIQMYVNGFKLDVAYYSELLAEDRTFREQKKHEVIEYLNQHGVLEEYKCPVSGELLIHPHFYGRGKNKVKGFNLGSPAQLGVALAMVGVPLKRKVDSKGKESYSCDKNILAFYLADFEVLRIYKDYKEAAVACSYTEKLIKIAKDYPNNRIHARYNQLVRTGRASCSNPNLQQLKRGPKYRKGFLAEINRILCVADYSQLEIRLVTEVSGDANLLDIYLRDEDVHTGSAMLMTGKTDPESITKEERSAAKAINFGALYGAGAKTLRQQAVSMFGILWSVEEAKEKLDAWKSAYPGVIEWQRRQGNNEEPEVRTKFGRRRILMPCKKGESNFTTNLNSPIQGLGADCLKAALALLWEQHLSIDPEIKLVATCHDEIILEAPIEKEEQVKTLLKECMEDAAPLVGITSVPILADPSSGPDWSAK
tara:strand:+ start:171 stop:2057 length:1887 start_codon:yes stop_codon:yes gene_type:complete